MNNKKLSQKDAVFEIVKEVAGPLYSSDSKMRPKFSSGSDDYSNYENIQRMNKAVELFISKIKSEEIERPKKKSLEAKVNYNSESGLIKYAKNIIFNWLNKDRRLNGGKKYQSIKDSLAQDKISQLVEPKYRIAAKNILGDIQIEVLFKLLFAVEKNFANAEDLDIIKAALIGKVLELLEEKNNSISKAA